MSMGNLGGFDANAPENNAANVLPKGEYPVCLTKAEVKFNKDGKTKVLHCEFQVLPPHEFANKKIFEQIPFFTTNTDPGKQQWVQIGASKLSSLGRAVNVLTINDSGELMNKPCIANVKVNPPNDEYDASNSITKFKPRTASQGITPPTQPTPAAVNPPAQLPSNANPF
jgi:hypothetical protein